MRLRVGDGRRERERDEAREHRERDPPERLPPHASNDKRDAVGGEPATE
jgi:hypothetical protein